MNDAQNGAGEVEQGKQIYTLLPKAYSRIGAIEKTHKHQKQFLYRSVDDALNALNPALADLGLTIAPRVEDHKLEVKQIGDGRSSKLISQATCKLVLEIFAPDGSSVLTSSVGEAWGYNQDTATSKSISQAFKYAVFLAFCVPTDPSASAIPDSDTDPFKMPEQESEEPVVKQARILVGRAKTKKDIDKLIKRISESEAFPAEARAELLMTLDAKAGETK